MKYIDQIEIKNKKFIVRADLNVPYDDDLKITDDSRIKGTIPTLRYILDNGGSVIIMSHLGEPKEANDPKFSMKIVLPKLSELLKTDVIFTGDVAGPNSKKIASELKPGQIALMENLRFSSGEKKNDEQLAKEIASLGDVFVCDAFGTAHRAHASMVSVPKFTKEKVGGFLIKKELEFFDKALNNPKRPLCIIMGGAKVSSKLNVLLNIAPKADKLIIGGAMANTFLAAQGLQVGRSLYEPDLIPKAIEIIGILARNGGKLYLPVDVIVGQNLTTKGISRAVPVQEIPADMMALDIGPATRILYAQALLSPETILWNGPMGAFEVEEFSKGTFELIEALGNAHGTTVVGGGDTDSAIHEMQLAHKFDYISTGGGAFLELLEGKVLPGLAALE